MDTRAKGITASKERHRIDLDRDLPRDCGYVDLLLASSLRTGKCAKLLRNFMVAHAAGIPQRTDGRDRLFEPEAICQTIKVLEGFETPDLMKGPFRYEKGPLAGLYKKHFFQAGFLAENILKEIEREGVGIIFRKLSEHYGRGNYMGKPLEEIDVSLIAEAFARDAIERRAKGLNGGLTGEHLIYAARPPGNIYLYASFHGENVKRIEDCVRVSFQDFPELVGVAPIFESPGDDIADFSECNH
jgi:hypothetical protein